MRSFQSSFFKIEDFKEASATWCAPRTEGSARSADLPTMRLSVATSRIEGKSFTRSAESTTEGKFRTELSTN